MKRRWRWPLFIICVLLIVGYEYHALTRPLPQIKPTTVEHQLSIQAVPSSLSWPAVGQSAVGIVGTNVMHAHGTQKPTPTASTAKLITALLVLKAKPLQLGEQGPMITLSTQDFSLYASYLAQGGSVIPVKAGEQISEYQLLEAMLLPSANNAADSLSTWAYDSLDNYAKVANAFLAQHNLADTHVGSDASGFSASTTSTAVDLVKIGEMVMQNPVLAQIVGQKTAAIPTGAIQNVNFLLGSNNIVGIKTGNTDQAGGVFVSASTVSVNGKTQTIVTALANAPTLYQALALSQPLIESAQADFGPVSVIKAGAIVGNYHLPWGGTVQAVASRDLSVTTARGSSVPAQIQLQDIGTTAHAYQVVGSVSVQSSNLVTAQTSQVILKTAPTKPPTWWRLIHPF